MDLTDCQRCDLGLEETVSHTYCGPQLTTGNDPEDLVLIDLANACNNVSPPVF